MHFVVADFTFLSLQTSNYRLCALCVFFNLWSFWSFVLWYLHIHIFIYLLLVFAYIFYNLFVDCCISLLLSKIEHHELVQACCDDIFPSHVFTCMSSLMLCYEIETFSSKFPMIGEDMLDNTRLFQNLLNSIVLHKYKMTIIYELLMSRELNN